MPVIRLLPGGEKYEAAPRTRLMDLLEEKGAPLFFGCGAAACGTCRIHVRENPDGVTPMEEEEKHFLEIFGAHPGERLACQLRVVGDITIEPV